MYKQEIKIKWKTIEIHLDINYEFWEWFRNYVEKWLANNYTNWKFKSKWRWCMVWHWLIKYSWTDKLIELYTNFKIRE
jgi:hypothetical protein